MAAVMAVPAAEPVSSRPVTSLHTQPTPMAAKNNRAAQNSVTATDKKPRSERPCDGCRRRKSKCVIQQPSLPCVLCEFHKQHCTFLEGPLPRKRKLEDPWTDGDPREVAKTMKPGSLDAAGAESQKPTKTPLVPRRNPRATLDKTLSLQRYRHCRHVGASSALDTSLLERCKFDDRGQMSLVNGDLRRVSDHSFFQMLPDAEYAGNEDESLALQDIEQIVSPHGPALIDLYFEKVHPSFPIIHQRVFLDRHQYGDRQFCSALLASMYILAIRWWVQDPVLAPSPKPSVQALEAVAMQSLNLAMQRPKLSSLQAGLLLLQRHHSNTWPLTVQLVALSQDLGLHLDCSEWSIPLWERRLRKRLAWAVYMQDKWASLVYGRPSHLNASDWGVTSLDIIDFNEHVVEDSNCVITASPEEPATHVSTFMQMVELTSIMSSVLETFYTISSQSTIPPGPQATSQILARAKPVQLKLKEWFSRLPASSKPDNPDAPASVGYLHLAYFATEISIHRCIVQSLSSSTHQDQYALYIIRSAAKTRLISAMDFVNRLRPEQLDSFWYFPSAHNFALIATFGNLLRATAPGAEEAVFYETRLREYRWALHVSSRRAGWIGEAIGLADLSAKMLQGLAEKPSSGQDSPTSRVDSAREER